MVWMASGGHAGFSSSEGSVQIQMAQFLMGGRQSPGVWLMGFQTGGLGD